MLEILFEDEWLVAVHKPAGMVVHPTYKNSTGTVVDALRARAACATVSPIGRLDKLTSGVVLCAKTAAVHAAAQREWPNATKEYLAVVHGAADESGTIDVPLGTDPTDRRRRMTTPTGSKSVTLFERLTRSSDSTLTVLECRLATGRRHQIRVHLASRGWPVVGDPVYGTGPVDSARLALHAVRLQLPHPALGTSLSISAPVPDDLRQLLERCGLTIQLHV